MRRYERASTLVTSNRPIDDWGKLLGDTAAVTAMLDRLLHHGHILKCGPRSWRTKFRAEPLRAGKAMTRTMGDLGKMRPRAHGRDFFLSFEGKSSD
jgi:IstB-like ATP binding protein